MNRISFIRRISTFLLLLIIATSAFAQRKEGNNWLFGNQAGMTWNTMQTITSTPFYGGGGAVVLDNMPTPLSGNPMNHSEGVFAMSDADGNLLFYSDGMSIWDKSHQVMTTGLTGHNSATQSGIIIPYPGQADKYISFSIGAREQTSAYLLTYSIVDMTQNSGLGGVTNKNTPLTGATGNLMEAVAAVKKTDGTGYWIIATGIGDASTSSFNVWEVTSAGVITTCHHTMLMGRAAAGLGYLRFTVDGKHFAYADWGSGYLFYGLFDAATGTFPLVKNVNVAAAEYAGGPYGCEFSPDNKVLYVASCASIRDIWVYRFDDLLAAPNPSTVSRRVVNNVGGYQLGALQLAPDGRIYGASISTSLIVIDNVADYDNFKIHIISGLIPPGTSSVIGLPNFLPDIFAPVNTTYCRGEIVTLTASLETAGSVTNPVYRWYDAPTGGNLLDTGDTFTTSTFLMSDTVFYVSLAGDNYCEGERLPVIVTVEDCSDLVDDYTTTFVGKNDTIPVLDNDMYPSSCEPGVVPVITDGPDASGATADVVGRNIVYRPAPNFVGQDSIIYKISCAGVTDSATVYITVACMPATADLITISHGKPCAGYPLELTASSSVTNPIYRWYSTETSTTVLHEGPTFTTPNLSSQNIRNYYVSVEGDGYCENATGARRHVSVRGLSSTRDDFIFISYTVLTSGSAPSGSAPSGSRLSANVRNGDGPGDPGGPGDGDPGDGDPGGPGDDDDGIDNPGGGGYPRSTEIDVSCNTKTLRLEVYWDETVVIRPINPVYKWYDAPTGGNLLHTGEEFTISLISDTIIYATFDADNYCEYGRQRIIVTRDCGELFDDYTTIFVNENDTIPVLDNDIYPSNCEPVAPIQVSGPYAPGADYEIVGRNIVYKPAGDFIGRDSIIYTISCSEGTATVYITVIPYPDNIIDADCYITPPGTPWSIARLTQSPTSDVVNHFIVPVVGDIDNDGFIEIIVGRSASIGNELNGNGLLIYKFRNNQLELQQNLNTPFLNFNASGVSIANVDGGNYAAIFITTSSFAGAGYSTTQQAANLQRKLVKYIYNGTSYVPQIPEENCPQYSDELYKDAAQPMLVDFNGDGIPEVVVLDKIYNARTLELLVDGNVLSDTYNPGGGSYQYGLGYGGHPNNNNSAFNFDYKTSHMAIADMDNDGIPEIVAGHCVYKVNITNPSGTYGNTFTLWSKCDETNISGDAHPGVKDGATAVADMDNDGYLDVIVTGMSTGDNTASMYVWNPRTQKVMHTTVLNNLPAWGQHGPSRPFIGDVDNDGQPEIAFMVSVSHTTGRLYCYDFDPVAATLTEKWSSNYGDPSGSTTLTLFDFNMDGNAELVYRDSYDLYIINGLDGSRRSISGLYGTTANEYPVVADINNDGAAEIIVTGDNKLQIFSSNPAGLWAPARKVWNQASYNVVNVNDDLTIPRYMLNPATKFPGPDGKSGTADDVRPYNAFLQQQTMLNKDGNPLWLAPDAAVDRVLSSISNSDNEITINACFENVGDVSIGAPIYVSLYADSISSTSRITTDSVDIKLLVYESGCISITFDGSIYPDMIFIIVRINDREGVFPYQPECREYNNTISFVNPLKFHKEATLMLTPVFKHNGTYANPVSVLFNEDILYEITAINTKRSPASITITDTIPAYLRYVPGSAMPNDGTATIDSSRLSIDNSLKWTFTGVPYIDSRTVSFKATPVDGASASQPLYINYARVIVAGIDPDGGPDMHYAITNNTYHQGAGISLMTFSAGFGGSIYNADEQALDYMSKPRSGVIVAPDEGYRFAGWSHGGYTSLRGATIASQSGIMLYDTLTVYGNVELRASFVPEEYAIAYYLNGGANAADNPTVYTVESGTIALEAPQKAGDTFTGWTGSNGDTPQSSVIISGGSTGELKFYANFLLSGRENVKPDESIGDDKAWAVDDELYLRTNKANSVVRIYSLDGVLRGQHTIVIPGITTKKLTRGIYIVTINNGIGVKVLIE